MAVTQVWSGAEISINFAGIDIDADALPEDDALEIEQLEPDFTLKKGLGGGSTRSKVVTPARKATLRLRQCAAVNTTLSVLLNLDRTTPGGSGIAPLLVKDRNGNFKFVATQAFIEGDPKWVVKKEEDVVEWVIMIADAVTLVGGH